MTDRHQTRPYPLRMPDGLRSTLEALAERNRRSLNAEIVERLERSVASEGALDREQLLTALDQLKQWVERG